MDLSSYYHLNGTVYRPSVPFAGLSSVIPCRGFVGWEIDLDQSATSAAGARENGVAVLPKGLCLRYPKEHFPLYLKNWN
jgi:hypothetical protein